MPSYHHLLRSYLITAGQISQRFFGNTQPLFKNDGSPLTQADLEADRKLQEGIQMHFPNDQIESEEGTFRSTGKRWLIDPLDGTSAFIEGLAHWGPTWGLVDQRSIPLYGALYLPRLQEEWWALRHQGAFCNAKRLTPLCDRKPDQQSVLYVPSRIHHHLQVRWPGKIRNLGSTAVHLTYVAAGRADAAIIPRGWATWDIVAGLALLHEVQGTMYYEAQEDFSVDSRNDFFLIAGKKSAVAYLVKENSLFSSPFQP